jgi:hypothetical protein
MTGMPHPSNSESDDRLRRSWWIILLSGIPLVAIGTYVLGSTGCLSAESWQAGLPAEVAAFSFLSLILGTAIGHRSLVRVRGLFGFVAIALTLVLSVVAMFILVAAGCTGAGAWGIGFWIVLSVVYAAFAFLGCGVEFEGGT